MNSASHIAVVGVGEAGVAGLTPQQLDIITAAAVIVGAPRQLELLRPIAAQQTQLRVWPSPLLPALDTVLSELPHQGAVIVASGDPMFYGIGSTLIRRFGPKRFTIYPSVSSVSLAAARMGWPLDHCSTISLVTSAASSITSSLGPDRKMFILARDAAGVAEIGHVLTSAGWGASRVCVLGYLGGDRESALHTDAHTLAAMAAEDLPALAVVAVECAVDPNFSNEVRAIGLSQRSAGLPDCLYDNDGQLTKQHSRAATLAELAPRSGDHLWDIGGGSGSIAIEFLRSEPSTTAVCFERDPQRKERIRINAERMGVPRLSVSSGAPAAFAEHIQRPDVVFIGGGLTTDGVLENAWTQLKTGGRLVATAVTWESETLLRNFAEVCGRSGIDCSFTRLSVDHQGSVGAFTVWRPGMQTVHLVAVKSSDSPAHDSQTTAFERFVQDSDT